MSIYPKFDEILEQPRNEVAEVDVNYIFVVLFTIYNFTILL